MRGWFHAYLLQRVGYIPALCSLKISTYVAYTIHTDKGIVNKSPINNTIAPAIFNSKRTNSNPKIMK